MGEKKEARLGSTGPMRPESRKKKLIDLIEGN
jgi:hypothetical protein